MIYMEKSVYIYIYINIWYIQNDFLYSFTSPAYSMTISPASMSLKQKRPLPCMCEWYTPTDSFDVSLSILKRIAIGKFVLVTRL